MDQTSRSKRTSIRYNLSLELRVRKLRADDRAFLRKLGKKIEKIILEDKGYSSLDAFALEYYDLIAKPTLYQICAGKRDMKVSTLLGLSEALDVKLTDMLKSHNREVLRSLGPIFGGLLILVVNSIAIGQPNR